LKENREKYFNRLNNNLAYQLIRIENIKSDEQKLHEYKEKRKETVKKSAQKNIEKRKEWEEKNREKIRAYKLNYYHMNKNNRK
jgi:23S rRNA pseudoU1915 N3-methylase RlmH